MSEHPYIAVVTVSYASEDELVPFLESLPEAGATELVVVVADNKPDQHSRVAGIAAEHGAEYLPLPDNPGYGGGMNAAVATLPASVTWILISNPDIVLHTDAIDRMVAVGMSAPDIGSVGPRVLTDGVTYPSARAIPSLRIGIGHALFSKIWKTNPWTRLYHAGTAGDTAGEVDVGWLSGSCLLVRRAAFEQIGGFDDAFFMYFEDVDLGRRLADSGWSSLYVTAATAVHTGAHSTRRAAAAMNKAHHQSAYTYLARKYSAWWLWPLRFTLRVGLGLRQRFTKNRPL